MSVHLNSEELEGKNTDKLQQSQQNSSQQESQEIIDNTLPPHSDQFSFNEQQVDKVQVSELQDSQLTLPPTNTDSLPSSTLGDTQGAFGENFSSNVPFLDMLSADMDFEQAYSMYTTLQHKHAINSIELLEKVQLLNNQYESTLDIRQQSALQLAGQLADAQAKTDRHPQAGCNDLNFGYGNNNYFFGLNQPSPGVAECSSRDSASESASGGTTNGLNFHRSHILSAGLMNDIDNKNYSFINDTKTPSTPRPKSETKEPEEEDEDFDQFFSNTESNALETFLDSLANPVSSNPLQLYSKHQSSSISAGTPSNEFNDIFDLHTMKAAIPTSLNNFHFQHKSHSMSMEHETLKKELTEAFSHPQLSSLSNTCTSKINDSVSTSPQNQLPTPLESRESSSSFLYNNMKGKSSNLITPPSQDNEEIRKRRYKGEFDEGSSGDENSEAKKRRRSSTKPLLSLEQKRLNHSHSEQKRRQMCKLAYERCLRLIIDIEAFNKLPKEAIDTSQRKSKRARVNKEGLPNLSKHNALIRISNEIMLIQNTNQNLKSLLQKAGASRDVHLFEKKSASVLKALGNETNANLK